MLQGRWAFDPAAPVAVRTWQAASIGHVPGYGRIHLSVFVHRLIDSLERNNVVQQPGRNRVSIKLHRLIASRVCRVSRLSATHRCIRPHHVHLSAECRQRSTIRDNRRTVRVHCRRHVTSDGISGSVAADGIRTSVSQHPYFTPGHADSCR